MKKNIVITGTSRGIGLELVKLFAIEEHQVLALSRNPKPVQKLNLPTVKAFHFDITKEEHRKEVKNYVSENWKGVDILIHNAGQFIHGDFDKISLSDLERIYQTNVFGVFSLTQILLSFMNKHSHVITISSMGGVQGSIKFPGLTAYSSSKAAVMNMMEVLAEEYKENGPVFNSLALGSVQTEMFEEAFPGQEAALQPRDMALYIKQFSLTGGKVYNGKILQVSNSTP